MPVDLLHPLMADGARGDDESGTGGDRLHGDQAVGAVEWCRFKALFFVVHTVCMLPQLAVHTLDTSLVVNNAKFATDTLKAIVRGVEGDNGGSGGGICLLMRFKQRNICRLSNHSGRVLCI